jgi:large subunit ribosomal protein L6
MSRIGRKPVIIPENVQVEINHKIIIKGPLGEISFKLPGGVKVERNESSLIVGVSTESKETKSLHGLTRNLISNMIEGVTKGFKKTLELSGIGFRASLSGEKLILSVGFSHPVEIEPPEGIKITVTENKITIEGISKELVGKIAAEIRNVRPPDPYKGKGIRYEGEVVRLKPGKSAKAAPGIAG